MDIIVVGAGLAGLASAVSAALSGHHVTVIESAKELLEVCIYTVYRRGLERSEIAGPLT